MRKLGDRESEGILRRHGIKVPERLIAENEEHAVFYANRVGYPVVLKISSPDIVHKTDAGCVALDLWTEDQVRHAYDSVMRNARRAEPSGRIDGVIVQKMVRGREVRELIVGARRDSQFGPVVMFGLGGVFVEVLKDVSFRLSPLRRRDAREMIREIKGYPVLQEFRRMRPVNMKALEDTILAVSRIMERHGEIEEMEINPLLADHEKAVAVDTRIMVGE